MTQLAYSNKPYFDHGAIKEISKILNDLGIKKPLICEVIMDPNEEQMPKAINRKNKEGKSIPTVFEDMYPFLNRQELKKTNINNYEK